MNNNSLKILKNQGYQTIDDVENAHLHNQFRAYPLIEAIDCIADCDLCQQVCATDAIKLNPVSIDLGKCIFCPECQKICPVSKIHFTNNYKTSSNIRENLIINEQNTISNLIDSDNIRKEIKAIFHHSLKLRQVSAGGCNGCELELNAAGNVNFDMGRFGIEFVASPRHADGILITGPITENMSKALEITYHSIPSPKIVILCGTCAISGGLFNKSNAINRDFLNDINIDLFIPGCPPHPLSIINGILKLIKKK